MPINRAKLFEHRPAELEVILPEPDQCFRWFEHDYPYDLARWNHHPEFEIHLIRQGSGKLVAGDYIGRSEERRVGKECRSRWSPYH